MTDARLRRGGHGSAHAGEWEPDPQTSIERRIIAGYVLPNVLHNADDGRRLIGLDLGEMSDDQLFAERERVTRALAEAIASSSRMTVETSTPPYFELAVDWLHRRARQVQAELKRRRGSDR